MSIKLTAQTDIWVFLPPSFEEHRKLEKIFEVAFMRGACETSTIGPCIKFENTTEEIALSIVEKILIQLNIK